VMHGVSEGGSLAALFAATYPERCRALVLTRLSVPSSSFTIMDEKPTTSAARIAARRRVVIQAGPPI
jgi:pimeloyl-ACP methyl ester carboxylesterase